MRLIIALIFFMGMSYSTIAQYLLPDYIKKYDRDDVEYYCWQKHRYDKDSINYPKDWEDQSAVFLRYDEQYELEALEPTAGYNYRLKVTHLAHYRIKILDEAALENFSEVYYIKGAHGGYRMDDNTREEEHMFIKIIKPNGDEVVVDEKEIIEEDNGQRKVAVPNLEVGDVLDYALYTHDVSLSFFYGLIDQFTLNRGYPIKEFRYTVYTDSDWNVQFTSGEHELELKEEKLEYDYFRFSLEEENIEKVNASRWNYYYRTGPYIRMYVGYEKDRLFNLAGKGEQLHTSALEADDIIKKYRDYYDGDRRAFNEYASFKGYLKRKYKKEEISTKKTLEELYYYMRHHFTNKHYVYDRYTYSDPNDYRKLTDNEFTGHIIFGLKRLKIPYDIIVVVARSSGRIEDVINSNQTDYLIRAKVDGEYIYFYRPSPYTRFNRFPYQIESSEGYVVESATGRSHNLTAKKAMLPSTDYKNNVSKFETKVTFKEDDLKVLNASTKATHSGQQIEYYQYGVVDWMQMIWDENDLYRTKRWGHSDLDKSENMANFRQAQEDERKKAFESIAREHFDIGDNTKLMDYKTLSTANTIDDHDLQYTFDCELSDLVKKAGPNYVLKAGMLVGSQLILDEDEMERDVDIYMNFPRGYEYKIDVTIPEGYEVKGLNNFANDVDNEAGTLKSSATLNGNVLTLSFVKYYKHNFEPVKNWDKMKEFLAPGGDFLTKEILLKKKR